MSHNDYWSVRQLTVAYNTHAVLCNVSFDVPPGKLVGILGPNGGGKSTLLKSAVDLVKPISGHSKFFGQPFRKVRKRVSYMPQRMMVDWQFPMTVFDLVLMGVYPRLSWFQRISTKHKERVYQVIHDMGLSEFQDEQIASLSGGQQQRAFLARSLMQDADIYLMDEVFAAVDMVSFETIKRTLQQLRDQGKTIVIVHHELNHVRHLFDHVIMINKRLIAHGTVQDTFTSDTIQRTYGCEIDIFSHATTKSIQRNQGAE